jgi:hypothetical protein
MLRCIRERIVMLIEIFIPIFVGERPTFGETGEGCIFAQIEAIIKFDRRAFIRNPLKVHCNI